MCLKVVRKSGARSCLRCWNPALKSKHRAPSFSQALSRNGWEAYTLFKGRINGIRRTQASNHTEKRTLHSIRTEIRVPEDLRRRSLAVGSWLGVSAGRSSSCQLLIGPEAARLIELTGSSTS